MNKQTRVLALFILLFSVFQGSAQQILPARALVGQAQAKDLAFEETALFETSLSTDVSAARFAQYAQFLALEPARLQQLLSEAPATFSLRLPYNQEILVVDLVRVELYAADFLVRSDQRSAIPCRPGLHYRGQLRGKPASLAAFSFFDREIMGVVSDSRFNNLVLGKVQQPDNELHYMLYSDQELAMDNPFSCTQVEENGTAITGPEEPAGRPEQCIRVYLEADHLLLANRSSVQDAVNYLSGIFNQVAALYANEQVPMALAQVFVWEMPDLYTLGDGKRVLEQFRKRCSGVQADLAHLVGMSAREPQGLAYQAALCNPEFAVGYSDVYVSYSNVPTYSWTTAAIAHEMGHNLGAQHTQWCGWSGGAIDNCYTAEGACATRLAPNNGSTVMSFCPMATNVVSFQDGFGPLPGDAIRAALRRASCLEPVRLSAAIPDAAPMSIKNEEIPANRSTTKSSDMTGEEMLSLSPNPARDRVTIGLHFDKELQARVALLDMTGRPLQTQNLTLRHGSVVFELSALPKGIYLVQLFSNEQILATKRLIKE